MAVTDDAVTEGPDGWNFTCPHLDGCAPFTSTGWPTKKVALARGRQHLHEHDTGNAAPSLDEFRAEHGLNPDGSLA